MQLILDVWLYVKVTCILLHLKWIATLPELRYQVFVYNRHMSSVIQNPITKKLMRMYENKTNIAKWRFLKFVQNPSRSFISDGFLFYLMSLSIANAMNTFVSVLLHLGNLYFGNIVDTDSLNGAHYMCTVRNRVIRGLVQGDDQVIDPQPSSTGGTGLAWITPCHPLWCHNSPGHVTGLTWRSDLGFEWLGILLQKLVLVNCEDTVNRSWVNFAWFSL